MWKTWLTVAGLFAIGNAFGQPQMTVRPVGTLTAAEVVKRYEERFKEKLADAPAIRLLRVNYPSTDAKGNAVRLSGLVAIPPSPKGLVLYFHATTADRDFVPSRYPAKGSPLEAELAVLGFAAHGYAVAMPDYLGLGDHEGIHPYPLGKLNSRSGIDLVKLVRQQMPEADKPLYISGYSEGGAVAMWATREIEAAGGTVARVAPISGPYNLSGVQARSMLKDHSNPIWLGASVFVASYTAYGIQSTHPEIKLGEYFVRPFATYIPYVFQKQIDDVHRGRKLSLKAWQVGEFVSLRKILRPSFLEAIRTHDLSNPLLAILAANDCHDWTPKTQIALYAVEDDFLVPKEHVTVTIEAMRRRGVPESQVWGHIEPGRRYNHLDCVVPGIPFARRFFDGQIKNPVDISQAPGSSGMFLSGVRSGPQSFRFP